MNRKLPWIALMAGAYIAFVIATFPAATAIRWFAPPALRTAGVSGSVWSGEAALASVGDLPLSELQWTVSPLPLFLLRVSGRAEARLPDGFLTTRFSVSAGRATLRELSVSTSLAVLATAMPIGNARGMIGAQLDTVSLEQGRPAEVIGQVRVANLAVVPFAGMGAAGLVELGDFEVDFVESPNTGVLANIRDTRGPLEVSGRLTLSSELEYELSGEVAARDGAPRELSEGLAGMTVIGMAGEPDTEGRRRLTFSGTL